MDDHKYDLIVVGAGIYGLQAVRTYLEIHPTARVLGLEAGDGVGGVWSQQRYYTGFWTQVGHGCCEFSDRPMDLPEEGDLRYGLFNAKYVHRYIERYLDDHSYNGSTLRERFRCRFYVTKIKKTDGLWHIAGKSAEVALVQPSETVFTTSKLIIASGNTSIPNVPSLPNHGFKGQIIHIKDYGRHATQILSSPHKRIAVLGAGKSAADLAFTAAQAGHTVAWIVRKSGHGPGLFAVPRKLGACQNPTDVMLTRLGGTLSPSHLQPYTWWMWFIHTTWLGQMILLYIFRLAGEDSWRHAQWNSMQNAKKGYELLRPDSDGFFLDAPVGFIQDPTFWPTIAEKVQVYREDIESLEPDGIALADDVNTIVPCDVLLLGTGFKSEFPFLDADDHFRLGLTHTVVEEPEEAEWQRLTTEADTDIIRKFPLLKRLRGGLKKQRMTPLRLYNTIAPVSDDSIAFIGCISLVNNFAGAEWQALWAAAWLDHSPLLQLPSAHELKRRIAYDTQWSRRRYPYSSEVSGTTYDLECVPYGDRLLLELGLTSHVMHLNWWSYWTGVNRQRGYAGVLPEYIQRLHGELKYNAGKSDFQNAG